MKLNKHFQQ